MPIGMSYSNFIWSPVLEMSTNWKFCGSSGPTLAKRSMLHLLRATTYCPSGEAGRGARPAVGVLTQPAGLDGGLNLLEGIDRHVRVELAADDDELAAGRRGRARRGFGGAGGVAND